MNRDDIEVIKKLTAKIYALEAILYVVLHENDYLETLKKFFQQQSPLKPEVQEEINKILNKPEIAQVFQLSPHKND